MFPGLKRSIKKHWDLHEYYLKKAQNSFFGSDEDLSLSAYHNSIAVLQENTRRFASRKEKKYFFEKAHRV